VRLSILEERVSCPAPYKRRDDRDLKKWDGPCGGTLTGVPNYSFLFR